MLFNTLNLSSMFYLKRSKRLSLSLSLSRSNVRKGKKQISGERMSFSIEQIFQSFPPSWKYLVSPLWWAEAFFICLAITLTLSHTHRHTHRHTQTHTHTHTHTNSHTLSTFLISASVSLGEHSRAHRDLIELLEVAHLLTQRQTHTHTHTHTHTVLGVLETVIRGELIKPISPTTNLSLSPTFSLIYFALFTLN